jgi:hypothetical protein
MKKIVIISAAVLLLAAGCSKSATVTSNTSATTQGANQPASSMTSLKALMASGSAQKCEVNFSNNNVSSQGTIYVAGGKMRGDFSAQNDGKTESTHMINDGTNVYTWVDGMSMAMKMSVSAMQNMQAQASPSGTPAPQQHSIDPNANYQYNCSPWSEDSSTFTPPTNINFTDDSQMMMNMNPASANGAPASDGVSASASASMKAQECAACNNAGAAKAQCLASLHC